MQTLPNPPTVDNIMTVAESLDLFESKWWINKTPLEITSKQLFTERLIMPWDIFHEAVEKTLGRPVYSSEFARAEELRLEFVKQKTAPTLQVILNQIPKDKKLSVLT